MEFFVCLLYGTLFVGSELDTRSSCIRPEPHVSTYFPSLSRPVVQRYIA
jgi:hypothetical protein